MFTLSILYYDLRLFFLMFLLQSKQPCCNFKEFFQYLCFTLKKSRSFLKCRSCKLGLKARSVKASKQLHLKLITCLTWSTLIIYKHTSNKKLQHISNCCLVSFSLSGFRRCAVGGWENKSRLLPLFCWDLLSYHCNMIPFSSLTYTSGHATALLEICLSPKILCKKEQNIVSYNKQL